MSELMEDLHQEEINKPEVNKKSNHNKTYAETKSRYFDGKVTDVRVRNGVTLKVLRMPSGTVYFLDNNGTRRKATVEMLEDIERYLREMDQGIKNATRID